MKEKWLPLKAYKRYLWKEKHEERLYLAYNPKIIDRSRVSQIKEEISEFFYFVSPKIEIEESGRVNFKTRTGYTEVVNVNTNDYNTTQWNFDISVYYKPYLLSLGGNEEDVNKELTILKSLPNYKWHRIKKAYIGKTSLPKDIDQFTDEFICFDKDDNLKMAIEAYKSYVSFLETKEQEFSKEYEIQKRRQALNEKVEKNEIQVIDSTIDINDYHAFQRRYSSSFYDSRNKWEAIKELYDCGWNDKHYRGYKSDNDIFIFEEDMRNFLSDKYNLHYWQIGYYLTAMQRYLQFKWEREHPSDKTATEDESVDGVEQNEKESVHKKKIRIDIVLDDLEDFLDFLEKREINRQTRKKYVEVFKDLYKRGWNEYEHSTFIDDNRYIVDTKDIEVFVNGIKSRDFNVTLKEYEESLGLYLTYRWEKDYQKPKNKEKEDAIPPIVKERASTEKKYPENEEQSEGKKIFVNIAHIDEYNTSKSEKENTSDNPSIIYIGEPERERKTKTMQASSIMEDEEKITVSINFDGKDGSKDNKEENDIELQNVQETETEPSIKEEPEPEKTIEKEESNEPTQIKKEKKSSIFQIATVMFFHFGELIRMIIKNIFCKKR
ncbi:MAG: hypothetical protein IKZ61_08585 [Prevotella sp.]|nr:hypothetical protein [Prevotella sp.]